MDKAYIEIVRLLLESVPAIFEASVFAKKGGCFVAIAIPPLLDAL